MSISVSGGKHTFSYLLTKALKFNKNFADVSISDFSGFCSPELDSFLKDLAIFRLKCNEQHSSIPKSQMKILAKFHNEIKLDLQTYGRYKRAPSFIAPAHLWHCFPEERNPPPPPPPPPVIRSKKARLNPIKAGLFEISQTRGAESTQTPITPLFEGWSPSNLVVLHYIINVVQPHKKFWWHHHPDVFMTSSFR